nr:hypothetical protein [Tanacetum cinerariifolium]
LYALSAERNVPRTAAARMSPLRCCYQAMLKPDEDIAALPFGLQAGLGEQPACGKVRTLLLSFGRRVPV